MSRRNTRPSKSARLADRLARKAAAARTLPFAGVLDQQPQPQRNTMPPNHPQPGQLPAITDMLVLTSGTIVRCGAIVYTRVINGKDDNRAIRALEIYYANQAQPQSLYGKDMEQAMTTLRDVSFLRAIDKDAPPPLVVPRGQILQ